tara:strand:+ start:724 stop:873 length:150 start_codon:yes stop_codon:yes gene_type:complete
MADPFDETKGRIAVFGRLGSRRFNISEMKKLYLDTHGKPHKVRTKSIKK